MATKIPPHNLVEIIEGLVAIIEDENVSVEDLMKHIKGPDFPTAGLILGMDGLKQAYETGRGKIKMRNKQKRKRQHCYYRGCLSNKQSNFSGKNRRPCKR